MIRCFSPLGIASSLVQLWKNLTRAYANTGFIFSYRPSSQIVRSITLGCLILFGCLLANTGEAQAGQCVTPSEVGAWQNYDSATRGITQLDFRMECRDASTTTCDGDICTITSAVEPHYFVTLFGSCSPTDCPWGETEGQALGGNLAGWYYFNYDHGFAKRYVYVRTYPQWPGWLRMWMHTDFTDPGRADYTSDEWFLP
jgi:hypothetical protein